MGNSAFARKVAGTKNPNWKPLLEMHFRKYGRLRICCEVCGAGFPGVYPAVRIKSEGYRFCSAACRKKGCTGTGNPFAGKKHSEEARAKMRQDPMRSRQGPDHPLYGRAKTKEHIASMRGPRVSIVAEGNPNWKGGVTPERYPSHKYYPREFHYIRKDVWERSGGCCELCGHDGSESRLEVHHLDGDINKNEISKLKLVCRRCHARIHFGGKPLTEEHKARISKSVSEARSKVFWSTKKKQGGSNANNQPQ